MGGSENGRDLRSIETIISVFIVTGPRFFFLLRAWNRFRDLSKKITLVSGYPFHFLRRKSSLLEYVNFIARSVNKAPNSDGGG